MVLVSVDGVGDGAAHSLDLLDEVGAVSGPVDVVALDDAVLDAALVVVLLGLAAHLEAEAPEDGLAEDAVVLLLVALQRLAQLLRAHAQNLLRGVLQLQVVEMQTNHYHTTRVKGFLSGFGQ